MQHTEMLVELLSGVTQSFIARSAAERHNDEELVCTWAKIQKVRVRRLLEALLEREPTPEEVDLVLSPPYPELPYEA